MERVKVTLPRYTTFDLPDGTGRVVFPNVPFSEFQKILNRRGWTVDLTFPEAK